MPKQKVPFYYKDGKVELYEVDILAERVDLPGDSSIASARDFLIVGNALRANRSVISFVRECVISKSGRKHWFYEEA